ELAVNHRKCPDLAALTARYDHRQFPLEFYGSLKYRWCVKRPLKPGWIFQFSHPAAVVTAFSQLLKKWKKTAVFRDLRAVFYQEKISAGYVVALVKHFLTAFVLDQFYNMRLWKYLLSLFFELFQRFYVYIFYL